MKFYNTLGREKQEFKPIKKVVGIYACGPTVYKSAHIGNLRSYIFMDILSKTLKTKYNVNLVMNITDVGHLTDDADLGEDKLEKQAKEKKLSVWDIAKKYTDEFMQDLEELNIQKPDVIPKATDHIPEQIDMIKQIEKKGFTYKTSDGIYFDTSKIDNYGDLIPNFDPSSLQAGKRVDMKEKINPTDFALWKFSKPEDKRQMEWDSPWGRGFPGWHIECTAMGCKYLGKKFDIHTGGVDHITIHHTNEIAQAKGSFGENHANYWMHNNHLTVEGKKMSKSKDNFYTLRTIKEKGFDPLDYKYFCLLAHYRKKLNFTWDALEAASNARKKIINKFLGVAKGKVDKKFYEDFLESLYDDLNTPKALSVIQEVISSDLSLEDKKATIYEMDLILGIGIDKEITIPKEVKNLAEQRLEAKNKKDFQKADLLRKKIGDLGYSIKDGKEGYELIKN